MRTSEIRELSDVDIQEKLENEEAELKKLRLDHAVSEVENPMQFRDRKRSIARLKTVLRERELGIERKKQEEGS
ncbi:MAG: 50S ribosomal protein L29 [Flavobacteriales bacterium]